MLRLILGLLVGFVSDSNAGVGDTYYCVTKYSSGILQDKLVNFEPEKFTFQWKKDQIFFGKGSHWEGVSMKVASRYGSHFQQFILWKVGLGTLAFPTVTLSWLCIRCLR